MTKEEVIEKTVAFVKQKLSANDSGHELNKPKEESFKYEPENASVLVFDF